MAEAPTPSPASAEPPFASSASPLANLFNSPELLGNPYPLYRTLRTAQPVMRLPFGSPDSPGAWLVSGHAACQSVLKDARFSVDRRRSSLAQENQLRLPPRLLGDEGGLRSMLLMDPPDHTRVRGLVNKAFTPRRVAALRGRIQELVDELLWDRPCTDELELINDLAGPLPAIVIAELLGVPAEDHGQFKRWSADLIGVTGGMVDEQGLARFERALDQLLGYLSGVIAERRRDPRDDLLSAMIEAQEARDALSDDELLATSNLILIAGYETTTNLIGNGMLALLRHPEQLARLRADRALVPTAVEELLRFDSPVQGTARVAAEDVEIGGATLAKGALVITLIGAANRDPEVFDDPESLDVGREDNRHLSFGFGAHFCLGAPLARLEAEIAFATLLDRFPRLELADEDVRYRPNFLLRGLEALPVAV